MLGGGLAHHDTARHLPEIGIAVPALHALAVEDRTKSGLLQRTDRRSSTAASATPATLLLLRGWCLLLRAQKQRKQHRACGDQHCLNFHVSSNYLSRTLTQFRFFADSS